MSCGRENLNRLGEGALGVALRSHVHAVWLKTERHGGFTDGPDGRIYEDLRADVKRIGEIEDVGRRKFGRGFWLRAIRESDAYLPIKLDI